MSLRKKASHGLSPRQRLVLFNNTSVSSERALTMDESEISLEFLIASGVRALNVVAAGIRPLRLKQMGVHTASQLRRLGFDALHLVDSATCAEANDAFGADDVVSAFLVTPADAVALSGSDAAHILNITVDKLLAACAGAPTEALSVLKQQTCARPFRGVHANCLLDTGLRAVQLKSNGFHCDIVGDLAGFGPEVAQKLGFKL